MYELGIMAYNVAVIRYIVVTLERYMSRPWLIEKIHDTEEYYFSGKRIHRGQYRTASGQVLNADVNGALNILRKSSVVDVNILYSRGEVDTPIRIRIA